MNFTANIDRSERRLRAALKAVPDASIAIMAPEPIASLFRDYVEQIRTDHIELETLQTHMDDALKKLDEEAQP